MKIKAIKPFKAKNIHSDFGIEISGISLDDGMHNDDIIRLKNLLLEYHLLVIKMDNPLSPDEQIEFTNAFGKPQKFNFIPGQLKKYPEIFKVTNKIGEAYANVGQYWHSDGSIFNKPTYLSIYNIQKIPEEGSSTFFTSLSNAVLRLPKDLREKLSDIESLHGKGFKNHDILWKHPLTGIPILHISEGYKSGYRNKVTGTLHSEIESKKLHKLLNELLWDAGTFYEHRWEYGDIVIADNYAIAHHAKPTLGKTKRVLHRTAILGQKRMS